MCSFRQAASRSGVPERVHTGTLIRMGRLDAPVQRATYERAFKETVAALRDADVPFACMGSTALWALGGPEPNLQQDLDFAICEEDAARAAKALRDAGMFIQVPEEDWLFKAWTGEAEGNDSALVDLIFAPAGVHVSRELLRSCEHRSVLALDVPVLSATDLIVTKLHAINELSANYTSTLQFARSLREQVDWDDLRERVSFTPFGEVFLLLVDRLGITADPSGAANRPMAQQQHATTRMSGEAHRAGRAQLVAIARAQGAASTSGGVRHRAYRGPILSGEVELAASRERGRDGADV